MAKDRKIILTELATEQIRILHETLLDKGAVLEAEAFMDSFLDVVFGDIAKYADRFPVCEGVATKSDDYRIGNLVDGLRVIFQIMDDRVLILLILHESELPF